MKNWMMTQILFLLYVMPKNEVFIIKHHMRTNKTALFYFSIFICRIKEYYKSLAKCCGSGRDEKRV